MKPYGVKVPNVPDKGDLHDAGASSKYIKLKKNNKKTSRSAWKKKARNAWKRKLLNDTRGIANKQFYGYGKTK